MMPVYNVFGEYCEQKDTRLILVAFLPMLMYTKANEYRKEVILCQTIWP